MVVPATLAARPGRARRLRELSQQAGKVELDRLCGHPAKRQQRAIQLGRLFDQVAVLSLEDARLISPHRDTGVRR